MVGFMDGALVSHSLNAMCCSVKRALSLLLRTSPFRAFQAQSGLLCLRPLPLMLRLTVKRRQSPSRKLQETEIGVAGFSGFSEY